MVDEALAKYQETLEYLNKIQYLDEIHRCSAHISFLNAKKFSKLEKRDWKKELLSHNKPWKIVIVCNGNISRSPFTELILKRWFEENHSNFSKKISLESLGVLYRNKEIHSLSKSFLIEEGLNEDIIDKHKPRYWKDYSEICEQASIIITTTGEQANLVNFFYPGKAFMLSYVAEEKFNSVIDPALHRKDAVSLFKELKRLTVLFAKNLSEIL
jgi:protein-tyrosine-phosphatase